MNWCFFYILILNSVFLLSQTSGQFIESSLSIEIPFTVSQYSTKQGLPQSQVLSIVKGNNGKLILSTANGIVEYNGNEFKTILTSDDLKSNIYTKLLWNEKSKQLFGLTNGGGPLHCLYPRFIGFEKFNTASISNDSLFTISKNGTIYSTAIHSKYNFKEVFSPNLKKIKYLFKNSDYFLLANETELYVYSTKTKSISLLLNKFYGYVKLCPYNNTFYILNNNNIYKLVGSKLEKIFEAKNNKANNLHFTDISFIDDKEFFATSSNGLYHYTEDDVDYYSKNSSLSSNYLFSCYYDKAENCLFIGTGEKGLLKLQLKNCYSFYTDRGLDEFSSSSSIIQTKNNGVLSLQTQGKIYKITSDTILPYFSSKHLFSTMSEINDTICLGTWGNGLIFVKDRKEVGSLNNMYFSKNNTAHSIFKDQSNNIWIGTSIGVLQGTFLRNVKPLLPNTITGWIINIIELKNGNICLGGRNGIFIIDKNTKKVVTVINKDKGLIGKEVRYVYEDKEGKLWIATYNEGLFCYEKNKLTHINKMYNCLLNKDAFCLAKDEFENFYITSNSGLWRVSEKKLNDFYKGKINYLVPFFYGEETGILNTEFNGGFQNNFLKTKRNHLYFPSLQGLVVVNPEEQFFRKLNPTINKIILNDTIINPTSNKFNRKTYSVQFEYSAVNFLSKYNVYYQYKLENEEGVKRNWSNLEKSKTITFKLLPPGKYSLFLRAIDGFNDSNPNIIKYTFEIQAYFYETLWFKITLLVAFLLLTFLIVRVRVQRLRRISEETEKTKTKLAELELKAIQAQMNPHFIFNSLNSVKYYLAINDQKKAGDFLDNFSVLLRDFLEQNSKNFITIAKKTQILNSYIKLKQHRSEPSFEYILELPDSIKNHLVPTHILLPFVENAIEHGIHHSTKNCTLKITFIKEGIIIKCIIEDNGIGRKKSAIINSKRINHISKGIELVEEKIKIFKKIHKFSVDYKIVDLYDENGDNNGTKVIVNF